MLIQGPASHPSLCRLSGVASKTLGRSTGEKLKGRPPNSDKNFKLVNKKTSPKTKGVTKKVGRPKTDDQNAEKSLLVGNAGKTDLAARRVSTRSKKPGELLHHPLLQIDCPGHIFVTL